ncbi:MAG: DUF302 domain-containing protein [Bacteroidales bacterium]|nr:DUF302 domain-containing protein [Tenuifilaceae bacterium]
MKYYINKTLNSTFENTLDLVVQALKKEGFGIMTEIVVHETFKNKLNVDFRKYKILGACNPAFAHRALQVEDKIGTMLPCNVIVQELSDNKIEVAAVDPVASMQAVENKELNKIVEEVREKLKNVINSL